MTTDAKEKAILRYEKALQRQREQYATDPEFKAKQKERHRAWYKKNRERVQAYKREYYQRKKQEGFSMVSDRL